MLVLNFSHPLTESQRSALAGLVSEAITEVREIGCHFDQDSSFAEQVRALLDKVGLDGAAWQSTRLLMVPPSLAPIAAVLLAEVHGRAGYFVPVVRLRPLKGSVPPVFEVAEVIDLQGVRESARRLRDG